MWIAINNRIGFSVSMPYSRRQFNLKAHQFSQFFKPFSQFFNSNIWYYATIDNWDKVSSRTTKRFQKKTITSFNEEKNGKVQTFLSIIVWFLAAVLDMLIDDFVCSVEFCYVCDERIEMNIPICLPIVVTIKWTGSFSIVNHRMTIFCLFRRQKVNTVN